MFFDAYPRFYETGKAGAFRTRLNLRYEAIFRANQEVFHGARVLDIASHDGRWSLAALKTGAASVVGIEARGELVAAARENLKQYCGETADYDFIAGDVFDVLRRTDKFDVVLCLGFLYHTIRYSELMKGIRDVGPRYLIIDTTVIPGEKRPYVHLRSEPPDLGGSAVEDPYSHGGETIVGRPSVAALELLLDTYGFSIEHFSDWGAILRDNPSITRGRHYARGARVTARCISKI
jgi:hypothetical protein